jgi:hypothetical protein
VHVVNYNISKFGSKIMKLLNLNWKIAFLLVVRDCTVCSIQCNLEAPWREQLDSETYDEAVSDALVTILQATSSVGIERE